MRLNHVFQVGFSMFSVQNCGFSDEIHERDAKVGKFDGL